MQLRNWHVDEAVAKVTSISFVDIALFYLYLDFFMKHVSAKVNYEMM